MTVIDKLLLRQYNISATLQLMRIDNETRTRVINAYRAGLSRSNIIKTYKIHPTTLWRWVRKYKAGGFKSLTAKGRYRRPWNRIPPELEEKVVALKERNPGLTIVQARQLLAAEAVKISDKGIWTVWRRYGFAGFMKDRMGNVSDSRKYLFVSGDVRHAINRIRELLQSGATNEVVRIMNALPICPDDDVLAKVPPGLLSLRRQGDLLLSLSGKIPLRIYRTRAKAMRRKLASKELYYSALRIGIEEGAALTWLEEREDLLQLTQDLMNRASDIKDAWVSFTLSLLRGYALAGFLRIDEALECGRFCRMMLRRLKNPYFLMGELTSLYYMLGRYREAIYWARRALKGATGDYRKDLYSSLVGYLTVSGEYNLIPEIVHREELDKWGYRTRILLCEALLDLSRGDFQKSSALANRALLQSKEEGIKAFFSQAVFVLICCHAARGERWKAVALLRRYNRLFKKHHLERELYLRRILLNDLPIPDRARSIPSLRMALLLHRAKESCRSCDYRKALRYARAHKLLGLFTRLALFFPEPVLQVLRKGQDPHLPRRFLMMPVFQLDPPIYSIEFLGKLKIVKERKLLPRRRFTPKDSSFLIHLAMNKVGRLPLSEIYRNFWPRSANPARNLAHLLVRLRKTLSLPAHLLRIQGDSLCWNFYLTTDYRYFEETLAQAKALRQAGEWSYARKEYLRAFSLFRGEPFSKMYDDWSETTRRAILSELEVEVTDFLGHCSAPSDNAAAKRVRSKLAAIMPGSLSAETGRSRQSPTRARAKAGQ